MNFECIAALLLFAYVLRSRRTYEKTRLPDNKQMALQKRFNSLEKRMERDPELACVLRERIPDY